MLAIYLRSVPINKIVTPCQFKCCSVKQDGTFDRRLLLAFPADTAEGERKMAIQTVGISKRGANLELTCVDHKTLRNNNCIRSLHSNCHTFAIFLQKPMLVKLSFF